MILAAALLVLGALGLFVAGIATGTTGYYWACVALCVVAAVLLARVWWQARRAGAAAPVPLQGEEASPAEPTASGGTTASAVAAVPARHRSPSERRGDGVDAPDQAAPAGTVSGVPGAGAAKERPGGRTAQQPAAEVPAGESLAGEGLADESGDPPVEEVEVTDLLLVVDLRDEVLVVDEHPRYHLADCPWLAGRSTIPLPLDEARTDGFTPCGSCAPDRRLAEVERGRRAEGRAT